MRASIRQFGIRVGPQEGEDPKQLPPGSLSLLENAVWRRQGRIDKRWGTETLWLVSNAKRLITRGDELCAITDTSAWSYSASGWVSRGSVPNIGLTWSTMIAGLSTVRSADVAAMSGNLLAEAWVTGRQTVDTSSSLYYRVTNLASDAATTAATSVSGSRPRDAIRVLSDGTNAWVVYSQASAVGAGRVYVLPFGGSAVAVATDAPNGGGLMFGLDAILVGTDIIIAYTKAAGGIGLLRVSVSVPATPSVTTTGTVTGEASTAISTISLSGAAGEALFIAYATSGAAGTDNIRFACANISTLVQTLARQTLVTSGGVYPFSLPTIAAERYAANKALLAYSYAAQDTGTSYLYTRVVDSAGVLGDEGGSDRTFAVLSRPALIGSRWLVVVANYPLEAGLGYSTTYIPPQSEVLVLDITPGAARAGYPPVQQGKIECLTGAFWGPGFAANVSGGYVPTPFADAPAYGAQTMIASVLTGARRVRMVAGGGEDMWRSVSIGTDLAVAAGMLSVYDGERCVGYGFATGPLCSSPTGMFTSTITTGGSIAAGSYLYSVTCERRSASGMLYRSPVGIPITLTTTGSTSTNTIGFSASKLDYLESNPGAVLVYRSVVGGTVLQRIALPPNTMTRRFTELPTTVVDTQSDAQAGLSVRPAIYTAGGELEDLQAPSSRTLARHRNRVFSLSGDDQTVFFSKDISTNPGIAAGFHPTLTLFFPEKLVALASMDDKLIGFSRTRPWYVLGDGPAPNGSQSDFTDPMPIQSDTGCTGGARSVVSTPDGIMFVAARGFHLLTRGLEVVFIGGPVQETFKLFPVVTSAVLIAAQSQVRWTCNNASGTEGRVIVFDYAVKQWSIFRYTDVAAGVPDTAIMDAVLWQDAWTFVTAQGRVYKETSAHNLDSNATWVTMRGSTAWICEGGPLGYQHIRRAMLMGNYYSRSTLTLSFAFNFIDSEVQAYTWTETALEAFDDGINVGMHVGSQNGASPRARAFRVSWQDGPPAPVDHGEGPEPDYGTGQGWDLSAIGIEFIPKPDMDRRSAKART